MDLSYLLLADYANVTQDGKLNVMGIFSNIKAHHFPAVHPEMYLVAQLTATAFEYGRHCDLTVRLVDEDGVEILDFEVQVEVPSGEKGQPVHLNRIWRLVNTPFSRPGTYEFGILVDNDHKGQLTIEAVQLPQPDED